MIGELTRQFQAVLEERRRLDAGAHGLSPGEWFEESERLGGEVSAALAALEVAWLAAHASSA